jgi:transposase-like protein
VDTSVKDYGIVSRERLLVKLTRDGRSVYSRSGKQALIEACRIEGASIASIALSHGVNANLLHKWLRLDAQRPRKAARQVSTSPSAGAQPLLLPVQLAASLQAAPEQAALAPALTVGLSIVIGDARTVVDGASFDRAALRTVIDCLREARFR